MTSAGVVMSGTRLARNKGEAMEYVNIDSLVLEHRLTDKDRGRLLDKFGPLTPQDTIIATDDLELVRGYELVAAARRCGKWLLPLRRAGLIKETRDFPKRVLLELTSQCNSFCTMCPRNVLTRPQVHMDTALAKKVICELAAVGLNGLWLFNIGESLLHPDFFDILGYCRTFDSLGTIWLSTNGEIMDEENRKKMLEFPVDILNYSLNAMTEKSYAKFTSQLHFQRVHNNLKALIRLKKLLKKSKPIVRAQMIELPHLKHEIDQFKAEYGHLADTISINRLEVFSQNISTGISGHKPVRNKGISRCNRLERQDFFILSDASVSCCNTDFNCLLNIGSVRDESVKDIFQGVKYQHLIERYREGRLHEIEPCCYCRDFSL